MKQKNATCDISHLPIFEDDEIVIIPLKIRQEATANSHLDKINDNWQILTMPFVAQYDGYSGIKNAQLPDFELSYWEKFIGPTTDVKAFDKEGYYVNVSKKHILLKNSPSFEYFFNQIFCSRDFPEYNTVILHKQLYDDIISNVGARVNPEDGVKYKDYWVKRIGRAVVELKDNANKYFINENTIPPRMRSFFKIHTLSVFSHQVLHNFANKISPFGHQLMTPDNTTMSYDFEKFKKKMADNYRFYICNNFLSTVLNNKVIDETLVEKLAETNILATALELLNIGYLGTINAHQNDEMQLHVIVSQFIMKYTQRYIKQKVAEGKTPNKTRDEYLTSRISFPNDY